MHRFLKIIFHGKKIVNHRNITYKWKQESVVSLFTLLGCKEILKSTLTVYWVFLHCTVQVYSFPILGVLLHLYLAHGSVLPTISWHTELPNCHVRSPMGLSSPTSPLWGKTHHRKWDSSILINVSCLLVAHQALHTWILKLLSFYFLTTIWEVTSALSREATITSLSA